MPIIVVEIVAPSPVSVMESAPEEDPMKESQSQGKSTPMQEPLSDLAYDWVTIIQHKSEALRAYEQYMQDAKQANSPECAELMRQIYEQDANHIQQATRHLVEILRNGKMSQGGQMSSGQGSESMRSGSSSQGMSGMSQGQGEYGRQGMRQSSTGQSGTSQSGQGQAASRQSGMQGMQQGDVMQENELQGQDVIEGGQQRRPRSS